MSLATIPRVETRQPDFADLAERLCVPSLYEHQRSVIDGLVADRDGLLSALLHLRSASSDFHS